MKKVIIFLRNGFKFRGTIIEETEEQLIILDSVSGRKTTINKHDIMLREDE